MLKKWLENNVHKVNVKKWLENSVRKVNVKEMTRKQRT